MLAVRRPAHVFMLAAIVITTICWLILRSHLFTPNPDLGAWGVTFDLTLTFPLVYYFLVVRGGHARPITIAPVFVLGVAGAGRLRPPGLHGFFSHLRFLAS